jgi:hypothetical protein
VGSQGLSPVSLCRWLGKVPHSQEYYISKYRKLSVFQRPFVEQLKMWRKKCCFSISTLFAFLEDVVGRFRLKYLK